MIALSLAEIADLTGGTLHALPADGHVPVVTGAVVTDSREAEAGSLYVARIGESMDGHRFVAAARDNGAVAALTSGCALTRPAEQSTVLRAAPAFEVSTLAPSAALAVSPVSARGAAADRRYVYVDRAAPREVRPGRPGRTSTVGAPVPAVVVPGPRPFRPLPSSSSEQVVP